MLKQIPTTSLVSNADEALLLLKGNKLVFCNTKAKELLGIDKPEQVEGKYIDDTFLLTNADKPCLSMDARSLKQATSRNVEYIVEGLYDEAIGHMTPVCISLSKPSDIGDDYLLAKLTQIDSSSSKPALEIENFLFDGSKEAIMISDAKRVIVDVNKAFEEVTGFSRVDAVGKHAGFMKSGIHGSLFYKNMWRELINNCYWKGVIWDKGKNGKLYCKDLTIGVIKDASQRVKNYIAIFSDTSERRKYQKELEQLAFYDQLTGLPNRARLIAKIDQMVEQADANLNVFHIAFIDIDHFKTINDTKGHAFGDEVLVAVAEVLRERIQHIGVCGRISGDEFVIAFKLGLSRKRIEDFTKAMVELFEQPLKIESTEYPVSISIGLNSYPELSGNSKELLNGADLAMYHAKKSFGTGYSWYSKQLDNKVKQNKQLKQKLLNAIPNREFETFFQPIINLANGQISGCESLARWRPNGQDYLSPAVFIPVAEKLSIFSELSAQVLEKSCSFIVNLPNEFTHCLSVNVSGKEIVAQDFPQRFLANLERSGLCTSQVQIEVTETSFISNFEKAKSAINQLKSQGVKIALDDFGAGFSSISYLSEFEFDTIKLDKSLIDKIGNTKNDLIMESIVSMSNKLGQKVVAEGVESAEQSNFLRQLGCHYAQGFFFYKPMSSLDYLNLLQSGNAQISTCS